MESKTKTSAFSSNEQSNQATAPMEYTKPKLILLNEMKTAFGDKFCKPGVSAGLCLPGSGVGGGICKGGSAAFKCSPGAGG